MDQSPRLVVLIVLLIFIFLSPDPASVSRFSRIDAARIDIFRNRDLEIIANASYGSYDGLNLTGFRHEDGYQWQMLSTAQNLAKVYGQRLDQHASFYQIIDSELRGDFVRHNVPRDENRSLNLTTLLGEDAWIHVFQRNVTDSEGKLALSITDRSGESDGVKEATATLTIYTDSSPGNGWDASLRGVHFSNGSSVLTTATRKFNALPVLPQFTLENQQYDLSKSIVEHTVNRLWDDYLTADVPASSLPSCELIVWLQQEPVVGSQRYVNEVEKELELPEGAPIGTPPSIAVSAVIFSPDCGYILEADVMHGPKLPVYWAIVERLLIIFVFIIILQIALLKRQMENCATPSTRSRISYYSIGMVTLGDGLILFAVMGTVMVEGHAFLLLAAATFFSMMQVAFFEVKFIYDIWTVQVGDPAEAERVRLRRTQPLQDGLPLPATANIDGAVPVAVTLPQQSSRTNLASLYSRFYFGMVVLVFLSLWAMQWPRALRAGYFNLLVFLYFSMWVPQIVRNMMRNCRKALNWEYVVGSSMLRAVSVSYWYLVENNVLATDTDFRMAFFLSGWLFMQIMVLLSQQYLGPRLLVRESWCPTAYDYHPILYDDLEAGGMPIGELASASEGKDKENKTRKAFDCAICMNEINVPVISKDENSGRSWLEQRNYMVTPCRHIFHTECLEGWMNLRLVCPVCRESLPPL